jgi:hypothetical protein
MKLVKEVHQNPSELTSEQALIAVAMIVLASAFFVVLIVVFVEMSR